MSAGSPAVRRIRTLRWTTTAVFAAATALCLAVLVVIALRIDTSSRLRALDSGLTSQASTLAEVIGFADGTFDLSSLDTTRDVRTAPVLGVVTPDEIAYAAPDQSALPDDAELRRVLADLKAHPGVTTFVARGADGRELRWAAAALPTASAHGVSTGAIVVVGGSPAQDAGHGRLVAGLVGTAAALVLVAAVLGHVVSGFAMRPAVRGLADQERFLLEASHELRTPLTVLGVLLDEASADPAAAPDVLVRARRQIDRLATVTSALLLRARTTAGAAAVTLEPLRLDQLVEAAVAETGAGVQLHAEPAVVTGSPELIAQAVRNLVDNAVRHGAPPVVVTVLADGVEVTDAGPGIPPRERRRVRRPGVGRGVGTGTGLAIVEWVARLHGGALTLDDGPSGGLRATLTLGRPHRPTG